MSSHRSRHLGAPLVPWLFVWVVAALGASPALAQTPTPVRFGIVDNSFLVEEAFNQEAGVVQHIFTVQRVEHRHWAMSFTQEWPVGSVRQQLSATVPWSLIDGDAAWGDALINYRVQLFSEGPRRAAMSPRVSLVIPTSRDSTDVGMQLSLPVSKRLGGAYVHGNAGVTLRRRSGTEPFLGASVIGALTPLLNVMLEGVVHWSGEAGAPSRAEQTLSPGMRAGWNLPAGQLVLGVAVPVTFAERRTTSIFGYVSFER